MREQASLEEIEGDFWGDAPAGATRLVSTAHALRKRPVGSLGAEELRLLIGQGIGLGTLVPLALVRLERDPLAEGDFYPGDLLVAVMKAPDSYWRAHEDLRTRLLAVAGGVDADEVDGELVADIAAFRARA